MAAEHKGMNAEATELLGTAVGGSASAVLLIGAAVLDEPSSSFPGAIDGGREQHSAWATAAASGHFSAEI